jgi:hypothetical protein
VYGGGPTLIQNNRIVDGNPSDAPSGFIRNTRVKDNAVGGHQCTDPTYCFGRYHPSLNEDGRHFVQIEADLSADPNAVLWPTTGADVNKWEENNDLTPDKDGQVVIPS